MSICSMHSSGLAPEATVARERVEVADQQVERLDAELGNLCTMRFQPQIGKQAGVHRRVQGLDPTVEAFRESR